MIRSVSPHLRSVALGLVLSMVAIGPGLASSPSAAHGTVDDAGYIFLRPAGRTTMMNSSTEELDRVQARRIDDEPLLYVRREGRSWLVRDPATLQRIADLLAPVEAHGVRQGEHGARQGELGGRHAALGAEYSRLARDYDGRSAEAGRGHRLRDLDRRQAELDAEQALLDREQAGLSAEHDRLLLQAETRIERLLNDAIARGLAMRMD